MSFAGSMRGAAWPRGCFATVCTERPTGPMVSLAYSPDGLAWDELPGVATLELPPVTAAQCGDLAVDGIGGVWFAPIGGQQGDFVRLAGGAVTGRLGYAVAGDLELANGTPLLAADGAQLVAVVPTFGGAAAFAQATDDPDRTQLVAIGSPLSGRPAFAGLDTRDDRGTVVAVNAFPQLVALADGTTQWATQTRSYVVLDDGEAIADDAVNAIDVPERRGTPIVVTTAAQQVAIVNRTEFDTAADPGASGDVAVLLRPTGGSWSVAVPMLQSPGDQFVVDAAVSGDVVIAAGRSTTLDPATGALVPSPLIVVGDGVNWQTLVPPAEANDFVVSAVCPTGTGTAVLVGRALSTGARISLLLDTATATVTVLPGVVAEAAPDELLVECGYNAADTATPFVAHTGTGVYVSADAVTWTLVHAVPPGWRLRQLAVGRAGVAVMSNSGGVNSDFAVHIGAHASALLGAVRRVRRPRRSRRRCDQRPRRRGAGLRQCQRPADALASRRAMIRSAGTTDRGAIRSEHGRALPGSTMPVKLVVAYDGGAFHGFAENAGVVTVAGSCDGRSSWSRAPTSSWWLPAAPTPGCTVGVRWSRAGCRPRPISMGS